MIIVLCFEFFYNIFMEKQYTQDYIANTDTFVYQREDMFRINTDTSLLALFMQVKENEKVLDVGTNNGALLLHAAKNKPSLLYGIDIQEEACAMARYNVDMFEISNAQIECIDFKEFKGRNFDVIVCNPPYFKLANAHQKQDEKLAIARHEKYLELEILVQQVSKCLQNKGRFYLVHRADRLVDIMALCQKYEMRIKRLQIVYDGKDNEAKSILIEAIYKGNSLLKIEAPKYI